MTSISNSGTAISSAMDRKEGRFALSVVPSGFACIISSGGWMLILPAMYFPNTGPAMMAVGIPSTKPKKMTQPSCASRMSATAMGPGVGGMKLCVTARPASSGIP